jgi:glutamine amidotransferase
MIAIVDYGVGNLYSLHRSFEAIGAEVKITADPSEIKNADRILLPGVGAFGDASEKLFSSGLAELLKEEAGKGKPFMGICLGMQMLLEKSFEYGEYTGLGLIKGEVRPISEVIPKGLKIPHIGWNALHIEGEKSPIFKYVNEGECVYFVHSFHGAGCEDAVIATAEYGVPLTAAVGKDNVWGCQFHPEKSGKVGLNILRAFVEA